MQYQDLNDRPEMRNIKGIFNQISVTLHGVEHGLFVKFPIKYCKFYLVGKVLYYDTVNKISNKPVQHLS